MSDSQPDLADDDDDTGTEPAQGNSDIRNLRSQAKRAGELEKELAARDRRDAFRDAGLDLTDKQHGFFVRGYEGDLDPDKIRAAAIEAKFLTEPATPEHEVPAEEKDAWGRVDNARGDAPAPASDDDFLAEISRTATKERWTEQRLGKEISHAMSKRGFPTAIDGY